MEAAAQPDEETLATLSIKTIQRDKAFQFRTEIHHNKVKEYARQMKDGAKFPPVSVANVDGRYVCTDGWHRMAAHELNEVEMIDVVIRKRTHKGAQRDALAANQQHGIPYYPRERLPQFKKFIQAKMHVKLGGKWMSYTEIREALGGSAAIGTIHGWMKKHFPAVSRKMGERMSRAYDGPTNHDRGKLQRAKELRQSAGSLVDELVELSLYLDADDKEELAGRLEALAVHLRSKSDARAEPIKLTRPPTRIDPDSMDF